jgi:uncharacterized membrane protein YphA (DoxX/SURF4 family)
MADLSLFSPRSFFLLYALSCLVRVPAFESKPIRPLRLNQRMEAAVRQNLPMILIRTVVGLVFLLEGALKFLQPDAFGVGRFSRMGMPVPNVLAPLVGGAEIGCGAAILLNLFAGDAAIALLVVILTALITTKIPILLGRPLGPFSPPEVANFGWLSFLHEARTDLSMFFGLLAIAIDSGVHTGRKRRWYHDGS